MSQASTIAEQGYSKSEADKATGLLWVDTETGSVNSDRCAVFQIAALITDFDLNIQSVFMSYIKPRPELEVTEEALAINKLTLADLEHMPEELQVAESFYAFAENCKQPGLQFAGFNAKYDCGVVHAMFQRAGILATPYLVPWHCTLEKARKMLSKPAQVPNHKLVSVAEFFGFDTQRAHDALADIHMTLRVERKLRAMEVR